jgi:hypothetical protein
MIDLEQVIKEVSSRTGIDKEIVAVICKHPFLQTVELMKDDNNIQDILFNRLFKFKLKRRYKENKSKEYTTK